MLRASLIEWEERKSAGLHPWECVFLKVKGGKTTREHSGATKCIYSFMFKMVFRILRHLELAEQRVKSLQSKSTFIVN